MRTPTVIQMEAVECGAASLAIMLAHHGRIVSLTELRRECGVSRDGSKAANIVKAARRYGLVAKGFSKTVENVRELEPPFVVYWNFNHFLVVEGFSRRGVLLNDPAVGHRTVSEEEFGDAFTGVVLTMTPGPDFEPGGRKPSVVAALQDRLRGFGAVLAFAVLAGLLLVVPGLAIPALTQVFLDRVLLEQRGDWLTPLLLALVVAVVAVGLLRFIQRRYLTRMRLALAARMSARFFWHLMRLPAAFYAQRFAGEIGSRSRLNDKVADVLSGRLAQTAIDVVTMLFYAAIMLVYDVPLTLVGLAAAGINYGALRRLSGRRIEANTRLLQEYGKVSGVAISGLQSMDTIKASGQESDFFRRWAGYYTNASNAYQQIELSNQTLSVLPGLLSALTTALILVLGGLRVIDGHLTIGMLVAFQMLMANFLRPIDGLVQLGSTMQELRGDLARLDDVLEQEPDPHAIPTPTAGALPSAAPDGGPPAAPRLHGEVELQGVTFGYSLLEEPLIRDLDLTLRPGRSIALVGGSGSGKTTVARLLTGLVEPWSGRILFDGQPREALDRGLLTDSLALVDQDLLLFAGSVRDNLTLWDPTVSQRSLVRAASDASLHDLILSLPGGFDAELLEGGVNLSGGQRQRLEIARALVNDPTILVLDEATSALDAESERHIVERLRLRGCSCLVVAHRLSTIRDCDEILVMDQGRVVERGRHDELWTQGGLYAALLQADDAVGTAEEGT